MRFILIALFSLFIGSVSAFELITEQVNDQVYALVGEIGPRSAENHALNNTLGFIVTEEGVALVSSGATPQGAMLIEQSVARVTVNPIRWVINIGVQDHHWLGNDYFAQKGAEIIALAHTVEGQKKHIDDHLLRLAQVTPSELTEVKPFYAPNPISEDSAQLNLGGIELKLIWTGGGHFTEDAYLWLPQQQVVFAGDVIFHDRMLGIQRHTPLLSVQQAFHDIAALNPKAIIPGHGHVGDLSKARRDTGDYLDWLMSNVTLALEDWKEIGATVDDLAEVPEFRHLKFYDSWHRTNINRSYLQLEASQ